MSDLVGNPEYKFSHDMAHFILVWRHDNDVGLYTIIHVHNNNAINASSQGCIIMIILPQNE